MAATLESVYALEVAVAELELVDNEVEQAVVLVEVVLVPKVVVVVLASVQEFRL